MQLPDTLKLLKHEVDQALGQMLGKRYAGIDPLSRAVHYALEGGGKRVRPVLCILASRAFGETKVHLHDIMPAAIALEMVHTYSLVHDDLPIMDNDDLRRGRPTVHKVFSDAEALLVGDALLTDAFGLLAEPEAFFGKNVALPASARIRMVAELASACGGNGMVMGQSQDIYWTGRSGADATHLTEIHLRKTGRLLGAAAAMGALAREATPQQTAAFRTFGEQIGLAFQITDDLLDVEKGTGKSIGKDVAAGKLTYLTYMGYDEAAKASQEATEKALRSLDGTGVATSELMAFAAMLLKRKA